MKTVLSSYRKVFRPIFVIFSLYLMGDAFYRWDGFSHYASFPEFVSNLSLATILWSIVSVLTAFIVWMPIKFIEWICRYKRINSLPLLIFIYTFVFLATITLCIKLFFWPAVPVSFASKLMVLLTEVFIAICLTWLLRDRSITINERITPLVWLFGIWVMFSVPIAGYQLFENQEIEAEIQKDPQSSIANKSRSNIILVTFDALRTRDMSVYGYHRPTTPFINEWARSASLFTGLEAESNITTPTAASLMTGKRLWTHLTYHHTGSKPVGYSKENLPSLLKKYGYYNIALIQNPGATPRVLGIDHAFDFAPYSSEFISPHSLIGRINIVLYRLFSDKFILHDWIMKEDFVFPKFMQYVSRRVLKTSAPPNSAFKRFLLNIDNYRVEPFFAWIHLHPPHDPYLPPEPYMGMFDTSLELRTKQSQRKLVQGGGRVIVTPEMQSTVDILRARYNEFIRYCDKAFEDFIRELSTRDILNKTVIILSSDHGESFEHTFLGHSSNHLYESLTNIPFIIKEPGDTNGQIIENVVEQIDIPATILDFANIPVPSWIEGRSLRPLIYGKSLSSKTAFSMALAKEKVGHRISKGTIAVWEGNFKLIHYFEENKSLLFNLKQDPDELYNLFDKEPERGQYLLGLIKTNVKKANEKIIKEQ